MWTFAPLCLLLSLQKVSSFGVAPTISKETPHRNVLSRGCPNRRDVLISSILGGCVLLTSNTLPADASYGDSSTLSFPSYIDFLIEKNTPVNTDGYLYEGADQKVQLGRLLEASKKLEEIPKLASEKKWSQVQGVLTGPLGTLGQTLTQVVTKESSAEAKAAVKKVKNDVILIGQAASKKNEGGCVSGAKMASVDLEAFVRAAF